MWREDVDLWQPSVVYWERDLWQLTVVNGERRWTHDMWQHTVACGGELTNEFCNGPLSPPLQFLKLLGDVSFQVPVRLTGGQIQQVLHNTAHSKSHIRLKKSHQTKKNHIRLNKSHTDWKVISYWINHTRLDKLHQSELNKSHQIILITSD